MAKQRQETLELLRDMLADSDRELAHHQQQQNQEEIGKIIYHQQTLQRKVDELLESSSSSQQDPNAPPLPPQLKPPTTTCSLSVMAPNLVTGSPDAQLAHIGIGGCSSVSPLTTPSTTPMPVPVHDGQNDDDESQNVEHLNEGDEQQQDQQVAVQQFPTVYVRSTMHVHGFQFSNGEYRRTLQMPYEATFGDLKQKLTVEHGISWALCTLQFMGFCPQDHLRLSAHMAADNTVSVLPRKRSVKGHQGPAAHGLI